MKTYPNPNPLARSARFAALGALALLALAAAPQANSQAFSGTYTFTGTSGNTASFAYNGTDISNLTEGNLTKNGVTSSSSTSNFRANNWTTGAIDLTDYFEFTLTADAGFTIDMTSITFGIGRSATGTRDSEWRSSVDGYASTISTYTTVNAGLSNTSGVLNNPDSNSSWTGNILDVSGAAFDSLTTVTFRFYMYTAEAATGTAGFQGPLSFAGTLVPAGPASDDLYWTSNGTALGGTGNWTTAGLNWSPTASPVDEEDWDATKKAIFAGTDGTVTVQGGGITASAGLVFSNTGYEITGGDLTLGGAAIANNTITTDTSVTATISSKISGANGMTKAGAGDLILAGANDYTGGTTVSGGRLVGTTTSLKGDILNNAAVTFDQATNGTYADAMSGSGSLRKSGAGEVTLSGENTYSGGTEVAAGRLIGTTTSLQGNITNNAAVTFDQATNGIYDGDLTGTGSLVKSGSGTVSMFGENSYSGGTLISGGTLSGTTASLQGEITNNATVRFSQVTNGTYAGVISGSGSFIKDNTGIVTLTGENTYTGGTEVVDGTLAGTTTSLQGDITNNATVAFDQATNGTYAGEMSGTGSLTKSGAGSVTLTSANSYAGGTTVDGGTLVAASNTALGSGAVEVNASTLLADAGVTIANDITLEAGSGTSLVAYWNFNSYTAGPGPIAADSGSGSIDLSAWTGTLDDFGGSTINALFGDPDGVSLSLVNPQTGNGSYIQISGLDFTGLTDADVSFATRGTSTGFTTGQWSYSTDGISFTDFGINTATNGTTFVLAAPGTTSGLDGTATGFLRYTLDGGDPSSTSGNNRLDNLQINASGGAGDPAVVGSEAAGTATFTGEITINNQASFTAAASGQTVFSGVVGGAGTALEKIGAGTVTLSGASANTFSGTTTVSAGTLELDKDASTTAIAGDLVVETGATLLISASEQVADTSAVTLSGGTIARGAGVDEVFGDLNLTTGSFLDFGTGAIGTLEFGTYTPVSLLTVNNFLFGNTLIFGSNLTSTINNASLFAFDNGFTSSWDGSSFTITAIPEPSTYAAAAGLLGLMLWPARRRLLRDAKSILGLRAPMRDRLAKQKA